MSAIGAAAITAFQFHKGTIRTATSPFANEKVSTFQFHKGTIRTTF